MEKKLYLMIEIRTEDVDHNPLSFEKEREKIIKGIAKRWNVASITVLKAKNVL